MASSAAAAVRALADGVGWGVLKIGRGFSREIAIWMQPGMVLQTLPKDLYLAFLQISTLVQRREGNVQYNVIL